MQSISLSRPGLEKQDEPRKPSKEENPGIHDGFSETQTESQVTTPTLAFSIVSISQIKLSSSMCHCDSLT